ATAPAAAPAAAPAPAASAAFGLGPGLVHGQAAAAHFRAVEGGDGGLGLLVAAHLDETEPLGPPRVTVHDHLRRLHRAVGLEELAQLAFSHAGAQVAHVQLLTHLKPS